MIQKRANGNDQFFCPTESPNRRKHGFLTRLETVVMALLQYGTVLTAVPCRSSLKSSASVQTNSSFF